MAKEKNKEDKLPTTTNKKGKRDNKIRHEAVHIDFSEIMGITDKEEKYLKQVRFSGEVIGKNKIEITYSPKKSMEEDTKIKGFPFKKKYSDKFLVEEIPEKIMKLYNLIRENGRFKAICSYTEWETEDYSGEDVTYYMFNREDIDTLFPVDDNNKEIELD